MKQTNSMFSKVYHDSETQDIRHLHRAWKGWGKNIRILKKIYMQKCRQNVTKSPNNSQHDCYETQNHLHFYMNHVLYH